MSKLFIKLTSVAIFGLLFFASKNILACTSDSVQTQIGCIRTSPQGFAQDILGIAVGLAGGIAFIFLIAGGFKIIGSRGDPDALQSGKEIITSALAGLIFIIFSVLILKVIGIDILKLPGFSRV